MNVKRTTIIVSLLAIAAALIVPMSFSDSDAVTDGDVRISIPGYDIEDLDPADDSIVLNLDLDVQNSKTVNVPIYLLNISGSYINIAAFGSESDSVTVTGTVDKNFLDPADGTRYDHSIVTMSVAADVYADNHTTTTDFVIKVTDALNNTVLTIKVVTDVNVVSTYYSEDAYNKFFGVIPNTLPAPLDNVWVSAIVTLVGWIVVAFVVVAIISPLFSRMVGYRKTEDEKKNLRRSLSKTILLLIIIVAINQCLGIVGTGPELTHTINSISNIFYVGLGALIAWQIYMFIVTMVLTNVDKDVAAGVDSSLIPLFKMLGKIIIGIAAVTAILASFGVDLAGILVSAGVVTLGITLGAQNTLNQFFSGIVLLATRPFQKGDFVKIGSETYIVHSVRLMFCEFENWDQDRIITMPNNMVASSTIVNLTRDSPSTKIFIYMSVAYDADLTLAKELMIKAAEMHPHVITDGTVSPPSTRLTNFQDSGIEYRLACFVDDFDGSANYAGQIREIMFKLFNDNDIEIPYNRLEVAMLEPCDGKKKDSDTIED